MSIKISIIIPSYNVEKYIERCLTSTMNQDLLPCDYEVIAINDGSTDGTLGLINKFAENHPTIRIVDKKNEGLSATRNLGIDLAKGEYILFLDSDDSITENCLKRIYDKVHNDQLDILECDFLNVDEEGKSLTIRMFEGLVRLPEGRVVTGRDYLLAQKVLIPMVWSRIYRREFLVENHLKMALIRHEDEEFTPRALSLAKRVAYLDLPFYLYVTRDGSIMTNYHDQGYFDVITAMGNIREFVKIHVRKEDRPFQHYFAFHIKMMMMTVYKKSVRNNRPIQQKMIQKMIELGVCPKKLKRKNFFLSLIYRTPDQYLNYWKQKYS